MIFLTLPRKRHGFCSRSPQMKGNHQRTEPLKSITEAFPYVVLDASALQLLDFRHQPLELLASLSVELVVFDGVTDVDLALLAVVPNILPGQKAPAVARAFPPSPERAPGDKWLGVDCWLCPLTPRPRRLYTQDRTLLPTLGTNATGH